MESSPITFGTDGWRAIIGADYTVANVRLLTQAVAQHWQNEHPEEAARGFIVAYDTRFNAEMFAEAAAEVLAGNDIPVALTSCADSNTGLRPRHRQPAGRRRHYAHGEPQSLRLPGL